MTRWQLNKARKSHFKELRSLTFGCLFHIYSYELMHTEFKKINFICIQIRQLFKFLGVRFSKMQNGIENIKLKIKKYNVFIYRC